MTAIAQPSGLPALRAALAAAVRRDLAPDERLSLVQWFEANIRLSTESAAEPGHYHVDRAPYQAGIIEAFEDPGVRRVVIQKGAQLGITLLLTMYCCAMIVLQPGPILVMLPTIEMVRAWLADRLWPALRDSPIMHGRVRDPRMKTGSTKQHLVFPGGHLSGVGGNSPAALASRPERTAIVDEADRLPPSAGDEGDPIAILSKRTAGYPNAKIIIASTPTIEGASRVEEEFLASDMRYFEVRCQSCQAFQVLKWSGIKFERDANGLLRRGSVRWACEHCGVLHDEGAKRTMLEGGKWVATQPGRQTVGFHLSQLYSPWVTWEQIVTEFLEAQPNPDRLQVWINTCAAETFRIDQEAGDQVDTQALADRREEWPAEVPKGVGLLTAGADVQKDRVEIAVVGWGVGEESWVIHHETVTGSPADDETWARVDAVLRRRWHHELGAQLQVRSAMIDSGYATASVYKFVGPRQGRHVFASKGSPLMGRPLVGRPARPNREGVRVWPLGTDSLKDLLFLRLRIERPGPAYVHFGLDIDEEFLAQITSEAVVRRRVRGRLVRQYRRLRARNEGLDLLCLNLAALAVLGPTVSASLGQYVEQVAKAGAASTPGAPLTPQTPAEMQIAKLMRRAQARQSWVRAPLRSPFGH